jgi:hypothetical protein
MCQAFPVNQHFGDRLCLLHQGADTFPYPDFSKYVPVKGLKSCKCVYNFRRLVIESYQSPDDGD